MSLTIHDIKKALKGMNTERALILTYHREKYTLVEDLVMLEMGENHFSHNSEIITTTTIIEGTVDITTTISVLILGIRQEVLLLTEEIVQILEALKPVLVGMVQMDLFLEMVQDTVVVGRVIQITGHQCHQNVRYVLEEGTLPLIAITEVLNIRINHLEMGMCVKFVEKNGHIALDCYHRNNHSYQGNPLSPSSLAGMTAHGSNGIGPNSTVHDFSTDDTWVVDTGATHHMTANLDIINQATPYNGDAKITVGNGEGLQVQHIGSSIIRTPSNDRILHNVLHVPKITMNLLLVKKLCRDNGYWFVYDDLIFFIQDKATRVILYQGKSDDGELFKIPVSVFSHSFAAKLGKCAAFLGKKIKTSVWHRRLGHPAEEVLSVMLQNAQLPVSVDSSPSICSACIQSKMSKLPFHVNQERSKSAFQKKHSDV